MEAQSPAAVAMEVEQPAMELATHKTATAAAHAVGDGQAAMLTDGKSGCPADARQVCTKAGTARGGGAGEAESGTAGGSSCEAGNAAAPPHAADARIAAKDEGAAHGNAQSNEGATRTRQPYEAMG
eukprot:7058738-Lingulodinium_polyedra.AAC.1